MAPQLETPKETPEQAIDFDRSAGDFHYEMEYAFDAGVGLSEKTVDYICDVKKDPDWIRDFRKKALKTFFDKPMPTHWATDDLNAIDFSKIRYYLSQGQTAKRTWEEVPEDIKRTFERLGIPEQERKFLAGVEAQFDSEAAYSNIKAAVGEQGVIFVGSTEGLHKHGDLPQVVRQGHPDWRQQVFRAEQRRLQRRQLHLRPARGEGEAPASGLLPHQRRELRPVRADPHHRRRGGRGRLHGGLHRAEVHHLDAGRWLDKSHRDVPIGRGHLRKFSLGNPGGTAIAVGLRGGDAPLPQCPICDASLAS